MKFKYDDIKKITEDAGWTLISTSYKNLKDTLEFQCPEKHTVFTSFEKFKRNKRCPICESNPFKNVDLNPIKKTGKRILALDQATKTSGWAIFDDDRLIKYGSWTSKGDDHDEKISLTKSFMASMINSWNPDIVTLEDIQLQNMTFMKEGRGGMAVTVYKTLAALQGVLINYLYENHIEYSVVAPATWRNFSEIKGKSRTEKKINAQLKIKNLYDVSVTNDEADAILIGRWSADYNKEPEMFYF